MSYKLINANDITFNSDGFITAKNIEKMPCIYADLPNGMDGEHYVLEQETCEDSISRQAVMNCFKKWQPYMATRLFGFEKELSSLPSVTPHPKTGHWIDTGSGQGCSECGEIQHGYDNFRFYCAKCGSKNVIESEDKE